MAKGKSRVMPKAGYYRFKINYPEDEIDLQEVIHVTGTKKGNEYNRPGEDGTGGFTYLLWTCVPNQAHLDEHYEYFESDPGFIK